MTTHPYLNLESLAATCEAVRQDPKLGQVSFSVVSESTGGLTMKSKTGPLTQAGQADGSRSGKFTMSSDEPTSLLGSNTAVSPAEYILQGLAGCYGVTLAACAAKRKIALSKIDIELEFQINLNGFLGLDDTVRKGANRIVANVRLDSPTASADELETLIQDLEATSPIRDTLANPVDVVTNLVA